MDFLDVTRVVDGTIRPPGPKMIVCVSFCDGIFFRINTEDKFRPCVKILARDHPFLHHDSHIECTPLEFDEYILEEAVRKIGIIGRIDAKHLAEIEEKLQKNFHIPIRYREYVMGFFKR